MKEVLFNRNPLKFTGTIEQPPQEVVKNTLGLWNASIDMALKYGGELTRAAIGAMNIRGDRKYIIVDTKIHMLMPDMCPAIPSWHTDGVPRGKGLNPGAKEEPNIFSQEDMRPPRFHLLVTGGGCLTEFLNEPIVLQVPDEPSTKLYQEVDKQVSQHVKDTNGRTVLTIPSCQVVEFDWWDIHRGVWATKHEWRFLIRVTETDYLAPQTDLSKVIRTQQQVYVRSHFGW